MFPRVQALSRLLLWVVVGALLVCWPVSARAQSVTIAWDANTEADLAGYVVMYGTQPGIYSNSVDVGRVTTRHIANLAPGTTYYIAVKAYNTSWQFSPASNEVSYTVAGGPASAPAVGSVSPPTGSAAGGSRVTVSGSNFQNGAVVRFGGVLATNITFISPNALQVTTPPSSPGVQAVTVVNPDGQQGTRPNAFMFVTPAPTLISVSPQSGPTAGGTRIALLGTNFVSGANVRIAGAIATNVTFVNTSTLLATTPPGAIGPQIVQVINPNSQVAQLTNGFSYTQTSGGGRLTGVSPNVGPVSGGTELTLTGTAFTDTMTVMIGGRPAASKTWINATSMKAVTPPGSSGVVDVAVRESSGVQSTLTGGFAYVGTADDHDADGLPDDWETDYGLSPDTGVGDDGPDGDPDGDGVLNSQELEDGSHPNGIYKRYFAEGVANQFFATRFAFANPQNMPATIVLEFLDLEGQITHHPMTLLPRSRASLDAGSLPALVGRSFSTKIEADQVIVADRLVEWERDARGSHAETSIENPQMVWYFAEGATHGGFDLFYLLQNPNAVPADVEVKYLLGEGRPPITRTYQLKPRSRTNIYVDREPGLERVNVSAQITSLNGQPIIAERAMYLSNEWGPYAGGHVSAGVTSPSTEWLLAEGATGTLFDMFILVANPDTRDAEVTVTYLLPDGAPIEKRHRVPATSRYSIFVKAEDPRLQSAALAARLVSTNGVPIIVERAMWWPAAPSPWMEGHNSFGSTSAGTLWALAEGELGGAHATATYVLVANTSTYAGQVKVTLLFEDGQEVSRSFALRGSSRFNVPFDGAFSIAAGRRFAVVVESLGDTPAQIVVERAMYSDANGITWASGSNASGTKLR